jgi:hypothetical protein
MSGVSERAHLFDLARAAQHDRLDILGGNELAYAPYAPMFENPIRQPVNTARFVRDPYDRALASHNVRFHAQINQEET